MDPVPLHHVWAYTDADRAFWKEHLEGWVPSRIIDAHTHVTNPSLRLEPKTEEMRRQYWVSEVNEPTDARTAERCLGIVWPGREFKLVAMGHPGLEYDINASNEYLRTECVKRGWHSLVMLLPEWTPERLAAELAKPGVIGVKPYYSLIGRNPRTRDEHIQASIFDFLPHRILELLNDRGAWVTLHVPKRERLPHPDNIREVKEIRKRYPNVILVIAHLGRCYTEPHAREGLPPLAGDPGLYFDNSAVLNPAVHRIALERIGPERILYGTDNPVFYMRGRRQWKGRTYINRTNHDFYFNKERELPEIEARYTLYMYEALKAIKEVSRELALTRQQVEAMFYGNAKRLIQRVLDAKSGKEGSL